MISKDEKELSEEYENLIGFFIELIEEDQRLKRENEEVSFDKTSSPVL